MNGSDFLSHKEDNWETDMGAWFMGERVVFQGKDLFTELNHMSWVEIWLYAITGRSFTQQQIEFFSRSWVLCCSYPEPRIWNNRVAALCGTSRTTAALALTAATASTECKILGGQPNYATVEFIKNVKHLVLDKNQCIKDVVKQEIKRIRHLPSGYGRPIINSDERVPPMLALAKELNVDQGPHLKIALEIEKVLADIYKRRFSNTQINIAGLAAALYADQGLSAEEFYRVITVAYSAGMMACYRDATEKPAGAFFPLSCQRLEYTGMPVRKWNAE